MEACWRNVCWKHCRLTWDCLNDCTISLSSQHVVSVFCVDFTSGSKICHSPNVDWRFITQVLLETKPDTTWSIWIFWWWMTFRKRSDLHSVIQTCKSKQFHINVPANTRDAARYSGYLLFRKEAVWEVKNEQLWNNGCLPGLSHGPTTFESVYKWFSYWWERGFSIKNKQTKKTAPISKTNFIVFIFKKGEFLSS